MKRRRLILVLVTSALALTAGAPVSAKEPSCVGWFASTEAQRDGRAFADEISGAAHDERPFGRNTVAPFAHLPLEFCQP